MCYTTENSYDGNWYTLNGSGNFHTENASSSGGNLIGRYQKYDYPSPQNVDSATVEPGYYENKPEYFGGLSRARAEAPGSNCTGNVNIGY